MGEHDDLLRRFLPRLRYDSNEQYFADSPAQWTENPGHELRRTGGELLARAPELTLGFLGATTYADGRKVEKGDYIGDPKRDYRRQYVELRVARPELKNRVYGRAVEADGRLWLQYWLWYFYNDYSLALGAGLHEGDWEMVQFRMHDDEPDLAVYAQHTHAEKRPWHEVKTLDGPPARLRRPRLARLLLRGRLPHHRGLVRPRRRQAREPGADARDPRGRPARLGAVARPLGRHAPRLPGGVHQPSPTGPGAKKQWSDPGMLLDTARTPERREAPEAPGIAISRAGDWMRIDFDFERHADAAALARRHRQLARRGRRAAADLHVQARGDRERPAHHPDPDGSGEALRRLHEHDRRRPAGPVGLDADPARPGGAGPPKPPLGQKIALLFSRALAWVRGHLPGRSR